MAALTVEYIREGCFICPFQDCTFSSVAECPFIRKLDEEEQEARQCD